MYSKGQNEKSTIGATSTNFATLSGVGAERSSSVSNAGLRPRQAAHNYEQKRNYSTLNISNVSVPHPTRYTTLEPSLHTNLRPKVPQNNLNTLLMHNFTTLGDINNSHSQSPRHNPVNASSFLNGSIINGHNSHNIIGYNTLHYPENSHIGLLSGDNFSKTFVRNSGNLRTV